MVCPKDKLLHFFSYLSLIEITRRGLGVFYTVGDIQGLLMRNQPGVATVLHFDDINYGFDYAIGNLNEMKKGKKAGTNIYFRLLL